MITASSLISRKDRIREDKERLDLVEALQGFLAYEAAFKEAGLVDGCVEFSEDNDEGNLYGMNVSTLRPVPGMTEEQTEDAFRESVDLRELADDITNSGSGEFFTVEIDFATFRKDWIEPLQKQLADAGVDYDL